MTMDADPRKLEPMDPEEQARLLNLFTFARDTCQYRDLTEFHLRWYQEILRHQFVLLLSPRGHLKTSCISVAFALWSLTQDRNLRVLLLNEVLANSRDFLGAIKAHVSTDRFKALYGHWDTLSETWTAEKIIIPRDRILKEPSISVAGMGGTIVSQHADLVIIDDPRARKTPARLFNGRKSCPGFRRPSCRSWSQTEGS